QPYGYAIHILVFFCNADPVSGCSGSSSPPTQRHLLSAQHVVLNSAADDTICCVISLTCDAPRRGGKQRYDDFLSVVHFRKTVNNRKIGSAGNGHSIITLCFYKSDFNFYWLT
ncbi:hypothetical protein ACF6G3_005054, partial [Escherichia coli]